MKKNIVTICKVTSSGPVPLDKPNTWILLIGDFITWDTKCSCNSLWRFILVSAGNLPAISRDSITTGAPHELDLVTLQNTFGPHRGVKEWPSNGTPPPPPTAWAEQTEVMGTEQPLLSHRVLGESVPIVCVPPQLVEDFFHIPIRQGDTIQLRLRLKKCERLFGVSV